MDNKTAILAEFGQNKSILSIDLGTQTGWAMKCLDGTVVSGTVSFKPQRYEGGGMRYLRFKRWLDELYGSQGAVGQIVFEEVRRHAGTDAAHVYGGLMAHLTAWCEHKKIPYSGVPVQTIKRYATGNGGAKKSQIIDWCNKHAHFPRDDNEADALVLLFYWIDHISGEYQD